MARASVVLPEPDSPTTASVSPACDVERDAVEGADAAFFGRGQQRLEAADGGEFDDDVAEGEERGHGVPARKWAGAGR
jgi:hypothetical protein